MKQCWQFDPKLRPSFYEMITILEQFLADYRPESPVSIHKNTTLVTTFTQTSKSADPTSRTHPQKRALDRNFA